MLCIHHYRSEGPCPSIEQVYNISVYNPDIIIGRQNRKLHVGIISCFDGCVKITQPEGQPFLSCKLLVCTCVGGARGMGCGGGLRVSVGLRVCVRMCVCGWVGGRSTYN